MRQSSIISSPKRGKNSLRSVSKEHMRVATNGDSIQLYRENETPAFFDILIERRHADRLEKKDIDDESKLEVIYRILKD